MANPCSTARRALVALTLIAGTFAASAPATAPATAQEPAAFPFEADIMRYVAGDLRNPPPKNGVVFIGSSSIGLWKTLQTDFPEHNVINRGFGGSQLSDSVRYAHLIVSPYQPKMVVLFAGTNDLSSGKKAETVFEDFKAFVEKVRIGSPRLKVAYISVSPAPSRWNLIEEIKKTNRLIEEYSKADKNLVYVDVFSKMLDAQGGPRPELFVEDRLHMNPDGYAIWTQVVAPILPRASRKDAPQTPKKVAPKKRSDGR
jgi:lysophospholipase L1-like esterase